MNYPHESALPAEEKFHNAAGARAKQLICEKAAGGLLTGIAIGGIGRNE